MQSRQVVFYADLAELPQVISVIKDRVVPRYTELAHFLGLTAIRAVIGDRVEVVVTSFWDDGLEGSEQAAAQFLDEIKERTGQIASLKRFETLYAQVRDSTGLFRLGVAASED